MQYILQEDEYKDLVPKSKIQGPIDRFLKQIMGSARFSNIYSGGVMEIDPAIFKSAYTTLKSDLDRLSGVSEQPKTEGK